MPYTISIQEKQDYIRVEVTGERQKGQEEKDSQEFWLSMVNLCNSKGVFRILAIFNLQGDLPVMAAYNIGEWFVKNDLVKNIKIALVDLKDESKKNNYFVETVAYNRAYNSNKARIFDKEEKAVEWLLQ